MAIFKKLNIGDTVATSGTRVFKKLTTGLPIWNGTDLTGTTWEIPVGWTAEAEYGLFEIVGYMKIDGKGSQNQFRRLRIGYTPSGTSDYASEPNSIVAVTFGANFKLIPTKRYQFMFSGGEDVTNPRLIDWLLQNAELTSHQPAYKGGLYDADDNLVASWNALVYTYGLQTSPSWGSISEVNSAYYILANNSELARGTKVIIPGNATVGNSAFVDCTNLTSVVISEGITSIGNYAFKGCASLTNVVVPEGVVEIGRYAFYECTALPNFIVPNSVTTLYKITFGTCTNLRYNEYDNGYYLGTTNNPYRWLIRPKNFDGASCEMHKDTEFIAGNAFQYCDNLTSIVIPGNVIKICVGAFSQCDALASLTIRDGVQCIGDSAFVNCDSLTSVVIPDSVTSIEYDAFLACDNLKTVVIGKGVAEIGDCAFAGGTPLTSIQVADGNMHFKVVDDVLYSYDGKRLVQYVITKSGTSFRVPDGVTKISSRSFEDSKITSIIIPKSVTIIAESAFWDCKIAHVYYTGMESEWNAIRYSGSGSPSSELKEATKHFNYTD